MRHYLVWAGELYEKEHPEMSWEEIMNVIMYEKEPLPDRFSMEAYVAARDRGEVLL